MNISVFSLKKVHQEMFVPPNTGHIRFWKIHKGKQAASWYFESLIGSTCSTK